MNWSFYGEVLLECLEWVLDKILKLTELMYGKLPKGCRK